MRSNLKDKTITIANIQKFGMTPKEFANVFNDHKRKSSKFKDILPSIVILNKETNITNFCCSNNNDNDIEFFDRFVFEQHNSLYVVF